MAIIYFHRRKDTNEIFYVGKGSRISRATSKTGRNVYWHNIVKKVDYEIEIKHNNLSKEQANELEKYYIKKFGRKIKNEGILVNITSGGDGTSDVKLYGEKNGMWGKSHTEETKKKISNLNNGKKLTSEQKLKISESSKGRICSEEKKLKISNSNKGRKFTTNHKFKLSEASKLRINDKNSFYGKTHNEENKNKISISNRGENNGLSKLTESNIIEIRNLYGTLTQKHLSEKFGVSKSSISDIINRKSWKHI